MGRAKPEKLVFLDQADRVTWLGEGSNDADTAKACCNPTEGRALDDDPRRTGDQAQEAEVNRE
jgi:hypothetical protein